MGAKITASPPLLFRCGATAPSSRCLCSKWSLSANLYRAYHISDSTAKRTLAAGRDFRAIILTRRCRTSMRHTDGRTLSAVCCCFKQTETIKPLTFTSHELRYFFSETVISTAISTSHLNLKFWQGCFASPRLLRPYRKF